MKQSTRNLWLQTITGAMIIILLFWQAQRGRIVELDSGFRMTMGTFARVLVAASDKQAAEASVEAAFATFDRIEAMMSDYDPNSQLCEVNRRAFFEPAAVDAELFEVLSAAAEYSRLSDGAFDITVGPVVQLWREARQTGNTPDPEAIEQARAKVGSRHLLLDDENRTVRFAVEGMLLDVGGIAKGYAIDKAVEAMQQAGAIGGMVDIGGDLACFGRAVGNQPHWFIGLQDPDDEQTYLLRLRLDNRAAATSGDYRRFVIVNDRKYSHIVNPAAAETAERLSSVTVIAPSAMQADALATAVSVLGPEKGLALIETIDQVEAILIPAERPKQLLKTSGAAAYVVD
ncbi:MAG TPA: FAD:protein FMN transferase [Phycisphaerales bacterium]|nr:FAD:protein FMN transferase [Phycisphaerales bacterium]